MDPYNALSQLKKLVDDCDEAINEGKLAIATKDVDLVAKFLASAKSIYERLYPFVEEIKNIIENYGDEDRLLKYVSVYYRVLTLVSVPYVVLILKNLEGFLGKQGHIDKIEEVKRIITGFEQVLSTLKQR